MKQLLKQLAFRAGVPRLLVKNLPFPIIVGYHRVVEFQESMLVRRIGSVAPSEFERHIAYFEKIGCRFENIYQAISSRSSSSIALTFDDGFRDLYTNVFPILEARRAPFTLFLITSLDSSGGLLWQHKLYAALDMVSLADQRRALEGALVKVLKKEEMDTTGLDSIDDLIQFAIAKLRPNQVINVVEEVSGLITPNATATQLYLGADEFRKMLDHGLSIEAHGHEHWVLTNLSEDQCETEIGRCADLIEERFGIRPRTYAVAHGVSNETIKREIQRHGFDYIVSGQFGLYSKAGSKDVPRIWPQGSELDLSWLLTKTLITTAIRSIFHRISFFLWSR